MKYRAKVYWEMSGEIEVEANSPEEAAEIAMDGNTPFPEEKEYVQGSVNCDPTCDVQPVIEHPPTLTHPLITQEKLDGIRRIEAIAFQTQPGSCPP
jgi:hypothetical protein